MVVNKITVPGSHLVQQELRHDKFVNNDQEGALYYPDPNIPESQLGHFYYTVAPPLLSNFAWNSIKLNWTREYNTSAPLEFETLITLEGILQDGRVDILGEQVINTITDAPITEDIYFDLLGGRGSPTITRTNPNVASGKVGLKLPKTWMNYQDIRLKSPWMAGWSKRKAVTIAKGSGDVPSYPVEITVSYEPQMKSDFSDIRFTGSDGRTPICSYRYSYTASSTATFYVNYPDSASAKSIFMYYGNASATIHSNIDGVFSFADDFDDNAINTNKWQVVSGGGGSIAETGGILRVTSDGTNRIYLRTKNQFTAPYSFEFRARKQQNIEVAFSWNGTLSGAGDSPNTGYFLQYTGWSSPARFALTKYVNGTPITLSTYDFTLDSNWHDYKVELGKPFGAENVIKIYYDDTQILYSTDADGPINTGYFGLTARETPAAINADYDFVRFMPQMTTEPYLGGFAGAESTTNIAPDSANENASNILYSNNWGIKRPLYFEVTELNQSPINTNDQAGVVTTNNFILGYKGLDMYMAMRVGVKVLADKNSIVRFNGLEYAYEVI